MRHQNPKPDAVSGPWLRWALNVGAVVGSLCLLLASVILVFGLKPLVFASGSMAPAIPTGSLALAVPTPAADVQPGQVVSVVNSQGTRITHRAVANSAAGGLLLKGDANPVADLQPYSVDTVDRVVFSVPGLGFVVGWFSQPWLLFVAGLLCAGLLYIAFLRPGPRPGPGDGPGAGAGEDAGPDGPRRRSRRGRGRRARQRRRWLGIGAMAAAVALAVPLGAAVTVEPTLAAWAGTAVANAQASAAEMPAPGAVSCQASGSGNQAVTAVWTPPQNVPAAVQGYTVTVTVKGKSNSDTVGAGTLSKTMSLEEGAGGLLGGVVNLLGGLLQLLLGGAQDVEVSVAAVYPGGWESPVKNVKKFAQISQPLLPLLGPPIIKCH